MSGSPAAAYLAQPGDRIRINVVARSGKTTTYVILARRILQRDPGSRIALLTFHLAQHGSDVSEFDLEALRPMPNDAERLDAAVTSLL